MSVRSPTLDDVNLAVIQLAGDPLVACYANQTARSWLGLDGALDEHPFHKLCPAVPLKRLLRRLHRGRSAEAVVDLPQASGPGLPVRFLLRQGGSDTLILEGTDHTATRETEAMLASYSQLIENQKLLLETEKRRVERLLFNVLPEKCIHQFREDGRTTPERFSEVSVLFLDLVDFTTVAQQLSTSDLFAELNELFTAFDTVVMQHRCERIKTIGDAYLAVCGMSRPEEKHAELLVCAAEEMRAYLRRRNASEAHSWVCRMGIHTGPLVGGVVGRVKYIYDIFGDGVNTASRMETHSEPMEINLSAATQRRLTEAYCVRPRGTVEVKGKGPMEMFFLDHIEGDPCASWRVKFDAEALVEAQPLS